MPIANEQLTFTQGDRVYTPTEIVDQSGSRLHRLTGEPGHLEIRYEATVDGQAGTTRTSDLEAITYLRPSRYCAVRRGVPAGAAPVPRTVRP